MKTVMGIDLSLTATGALVLGETGTVLARETIGTTPSTPHRQRLIHVADKVAALVDRYQPVMAMREGPAHNARFGVHLAGQVHGAVDYAMEKASLVMPLDVAPATLKKFATGRGTGEKGDIKMWVLDKWGEKFSDNNQSDAYVLARIAGLAVGFFPMTSRHEGECLKTVLSAAGMKAQAKAVKMIRKDMRVCACGTKMKTGIEMESGRCAECIRTKPVTEGGITA